MIRSCLGLIRSLRSEARPGRYGAARRYLRAASEHGCEDYGGLVGDAPELSTPRPSWPPRSLVGLTVLIVDDDEDSVDYFAMVLRSAGAAVATASTAVDAVGVLQVQRPDVVLSDIAMPGQDGYWLVRAIQELANPALSGVPVVATTAYGDVHSRKRTLAAGFVDHLAKPVEPDVLCVTIARVAGR